MGRPWSLLRTQVGSTDKRSFARYDTLGNLLTGDTVTRVPSHRPLGVVPVVGRASYVFLILDFHSSSKRSVDHSFFPDPLFPRKTPKPTKTRKKKIKL